MEWRTPQALAERPISVQVAQPSPREQERPPPDLVVVAVGAIDEPWFSDRFPEALLRHSRFDGHDIGVEHILVSSRAIAQALPGLENPSGPSLLRDTLNLLMAAGVQQIDVLVGRTTDVRPWDYHDQRVYDALSPYLAEMPGTIVIMPDFTGPAQVGPQRAEQAEHRVERARTVLDHFGPDLTARYQMAVLDLPDLDDDDLRSIFNKAAGLDVSFVRWRGRPRPMRAHGWRCASAIIAGSMAAAEGARLLGVKGHILPLLPGRALPSGRFEQLQYDEPPPRDSEFERLLSTVRISHDSQLALIYSEPTFRHPLGEWTLSAMRVAKTLHYRIYEAASNFVFRPAHPLEATALATSVRLAMEPFVSVGLLRGPTPGSGPSVSGSVERVQGGAYSLVADVTGTLMPWSRDITVRVSLRPNSSPLLEAS